MIHISTVGPSVEATFESGTVEVTARGNNLSEAIENLVVRFKELQMTVIEELQSYGFIRSRESGVAS